MSESKRANNQISFKNRKKLASDFKGNDLRRSNCFNVDFKASDFSETSFRGAQFKACKFDQCKFDWAECVAVNFKNSQFKNVNFKNTIFDLANLENADFEGATFENVIFVGTDLSLAKNLELAGQSVQVFETIPELEISPLLEKSVKEAMTNPYVKYARVLDTKDGKVNPISIMLLLEKFDEATLSKALQSMKKKIDYDLCTLSTVIKYIETFK
ncbi:MAG: pentapeptide repeat-containing protein [Cellulosilyticaceae bacterium]